MHSEHSMHTSMVTKALLQMPCGCAICILIRFVDVDGYVRTLQQQLFGFVDLSIYISLGRILHNTISKQCLEVKNTKVSFMSFDNLNMLFFLVDHSHLMFHVLVLASSLNL